MPVRDEAKPAEDLGLRRLAKQSEEQATQALAELHASEAEDTRLENDSAADWQCGCCDDPVRVPLGAIVVHEGTHLQYSAFNGLTVNGEPVDETG